MVSPRDAKSLVTNNNECVEIYLQKPILTSLCMYVNVLVFTIENCKCLVHQLMKSIYCNMILQVVYIAIHCYA